MTVSATVKSVANTLTRLLHSDEPTFDLAVIARATESSVTIHPQLDDLLGADLARRVVALAVAWRKFWPVWQRVSGAGHQGRAVSLTALRRDGARLSPLAAAMWARVDAQSFGWGAAAAITASEAVRLDHEGSPTKAPILRQLLDVIASPLPAVPTKFRAMPSIPTTITLSEAWTPVPPDDPDAVLVLRFDQRTLTVDPYRRTAMEDTMPKPNTLTHRWMTEPDAWHRAAQKGELGEHVIVKSGVGVETVGKASDRRVKFTLSTDQVDRDLDTIAQTGWELDNYKKNPVVMWAHDYSQLPLGKAVEIGIEKGNLIAVAEFVPKDIHPFADTVYRLIDEFGICGVSVGFKPKQYRFNDERKGVDFAQQELLEFSVVPIPSNPGSLRVMNALGKAVAAGVDLRHLHKWAVLTLKNINKATLPAMGTQDNEGCELGHICPKYEGQPCPLAESCPSHKSVGKRGRVLSAANETKLREAVLTIGSVLDLLAKPSESAVEDDSDEAEAKQGYRKPEGGERRPRPNLQEVYDRLRDLPKPKPKPELPRVLNPPTPSETEPEPEPGGYVKPTSERRRRAIEAAPSLTRAEVKALCPSCAETMEMLGWSRLKLTPDLSEFFRKAGFSEGLCNSAGDPSEEGFRTACMEMMEGKVDDTGAFCNSLKQWCLGEKSIISNAVVAKRIEERDGKFVVLSEDGKVLGTHETRAEALAQLRAVEANKNKGIEDDDDMIVLDDEENDEGIAIEGVESIEDLRSELHAISKSVVNNLSLRASGRVD